MDIEKRPLIEMKTKPQRLQSCLADPQAEALQAYEDKDYKAFLDAVSEPDFEPNQEYGDDLPRTLADIIVEDAVGRDIFLMALIKAGGHTDILNPILETIPFHDAIKKQDPPLLKVCLRGVQNINVQDGEGSTALHIATEALSGAEEEEVDKLLEIISILLQVPDIDVEQEDLKGESTPLHYAALAASERAVDLLLSFGANHQNTNSGEKIADIIRQNIPGFDSDRFQTVRKGRPSKNVLFNLVELADNVQGFRNYTLHRPEIDWNVDNGQYTLLQYASEQGRHQIVGYLLESGADPNRTGALDTPPWAIAAYNGYHKVLQTFFDKLTDADIRRAMLSTDAKHGNRTILHQIVRQHSPKLENPFRDPNIDYAECLKILFDDKKQGKGKSRWWQYTERIINFKDAHGETALHYATQQPNQEIIKLLLSHGANMGVRNAEERPPVQKILPSTLQEFLDDCITSEGVITDDNFRVNFNYKFLAPPLLDPEVLNQFETTKDCESSKDRNPRPETDALWYLSESKEHRSLLKHPVISSFLLMKWQRIRSVYYISLLIYALFVLCLTILILFDYGGCSHFGATVTEPVVEPESVIEDYADLPESDCRMDTTWLKVVVGGFLIFLGLIEILQLAVSVKRYFASTTNYIQLAILIGGAVIILDRSLEWGQKRQLAALLIIFSWSELIIMIGQHPSLSTNVTMLYTVVGTFFKFLLWYTSFIIAFAFAFYIMFHADTSTEEIEEPGHFDSVGTCIVKTSAMFVGELEFSDIPFTRSNPLEYLVFIAFIFLIVVVLMNLLNGLAVSDTGLIREEAAVLSLKSQVDLISYWEAILLNDPYKFLTSWPKFLSALPSCSCCFWVKRIPVLETILSKITGGARILLFYECLPDKSATFYPNKNKQRSCIPYRKRIKVETTGSEAVRLEVRKDVLDAAKFIILERSRGAEGGSEVIEKLNHMEARLEALTLALQTYLQNFNK